jgi:hypothetical protein
MPLDSIFLLFELLIGAKKRLTNIVLALLTMTAAGPNQIARADQPASQALDGVCKGDSIPPGFVAVGEIESPECKPSPPAQKNSWLIDKVHDKIVACAPPDYDRGYPPVIGYLVCKRLFLSQCPPTLDGTANAYELTLGRSCDSTNLIKFCARSTADPRPWGKGGVMPIEDNE